jgi:uncharacterized protein DUF4112
LPAVSDTTSLERVRALARLLDSAVRIPGTNIRLGADSVVGLIPGLGDMAGAVLSGYIVLVATRLGVPVAVVTRMLVNIGIDTLAGSVPLVGDLFDVGWKANMRNVALLERHVGDAAKTGRSSRWLVTAMVVAAIALLALVGVGIVATIRALFRSL